MRVCECAQKDVAVLGLGREGASAVRYLHAHLPGQALTIYAEEQPGTTYRNTLDPERDTLILGPLDKDQLARHDVLIRSPGISVYRPELQHARSGGVLVTTPSSIWFSEHPGARSLCVTGTKGKSTTAALIAHLLTDCGVRVQLAGNIGQPLLDCEDEAIDWWVIELSSYQLADLQAEPRVGVILNLSDEHLDWHGGGESYRRDKLRLVELLAARPLIANSADPELADVLSERDNVHWFGSGDDDTLRGRFLDEHGAPIPGTLPSSLSGPHNLLNLAAALTAIHVAGVRLEDPVRSISSFRGLPHRLERLGEMHGLAWVNDSLATTPVATLVALEALPAQDVTLLIGGFDRGLDWAAAFDKMRSFLPWAIVTLPDNGPILAARIRERGMLPEDRIYEATNLPDAVQWAVRHSKSGGIVLLSPGAPSFPHYRDFAQRGEDFARLAGLDSRGLDRGSG